MAWLRLRRRFGGAAGDGVVGDGVAVGGGGGGAVGDVVAGGGAAADADAGFGVDMAGGWLMTV